MEMQRYLLVLDKDLDADLTAAAKPQSRAALSVITGQVLHGFFDVTLRFLVSGLTVLVVVLLAGPHRWAVAPRAPGRRVAGSAGQLVSAAGGHASSDGTVTWVRRHLHLLRQLGHPSSSSPSTWRSMSPDCTGCATQSPPHSLPPLPAPGRNRGH